MPTITIDLTAQQAARLQEAWQEQFGVTPTLADVMTHLTRELKAIVFHGEKAKAERLASAPTPFGI